MADLSEHDRAILNCVFNPNLPLEESNNEELELKDEEDLTEEVKQSRVLEAQAISLAEKGDLEEALKTINKAIKIAPRRASLYNNRAHILQFQRNFKDAFEDLTTSITLASNKQLQTLCQAYCQRGILHRRTEHIELAKADFAVAASMGNRFAKGQLVELNPYAALCNQMLRQVMETLK